MQQESRLGEGTEEKITTSYRAGEVIYTAGSRGIAWRVISGSVRLDRNGPDESLFASLALRGDVIGAETLLFGCYSFDARVVSPCVLGPWLERQGCPSGEALLQTLAKVEHRTANAMSLRSGDALNRVRRLILMLVQEDTPSVPSTQIALPTLRDMADITDLTAETVSRAISKLRKEGLLNREGWRHASIRTG